MFQNCLVDSMTLREDSSIVRTFLLPGLMPSVILTKTRNFVLLTLSTCGIECVGYYIPGIMATWLALIRAQLVDIRDPEYYYVWERLFSSLRPGAWSEARIEEAIGLNGMDVPIFAEMLVQFYLVNGKTSSFRTLRRRFPSIVTRACVACAVTRIKKASVTQWPGSMRVRPGRGRYILYDEDETEVGDDVWWRECSIKRTVEKIRRDACIKCKRRESRGYAM